MTREEARERIRQNKAAAEFYAGQSRINAEIENSLKDSEAFDMAIEALQDRPTDRLVKAFAESLTYEEVIRGEEYAKGYADGLKEQLADKPTGEWLDSGIGGAKVCSVCNAHMGLSSFNYCPRCGADMRSGDTE